MMKYLTFLIPLVFTTIAISAKEDIQNNLDLCGAGFELPVRAKVNKANIPVNDNVTIFKKDYVAKYKRNNVKITAGLTCQTPQGTSFNGSNEELASFINSALMALKDQGAQNIEFTAISNTENFFEGNLSSRMYDFNLVAASGKSIVIKNLYVFDPALSTIYIASINGNKVDEQTLSEEFNKFIGSLKIQNN